MIHASRKVSMDRCHLYLDKIKLLQKEDRKWNALNVIECNMKIFFGISFVTLAGCY